MSEVMKDYAMIKLFGKTISLPPDEVVVSDITVPDQRQSYSAASNSQDSKDDLGEEILEDDFTDPTGETLTEFATSSEASDEEPTTPSVEKSASQEKTLKKPDKILPCPRCTSMDTKFCYYNNHNVSQPRHFCKNCQRYWTAGGAMRNVPFGSGRRKTKNASVTNYGHIVVSDAMKPNGFLVFGSDRPVCESMTSALNFTERPQNCGSNKSYEHSSKSSCTARAFGPSGFPVAFHPSIPQWACAIPNQPWASIASSSGPSGPITSPTSTLRKHSREGNMLIGASKFGKENNSEIISPWSHVLVPKTLRIDDPNKAAKSSIWSAVGIKNEKIGSINETSLFKAFESKGARNINDIDNTQMVLQANPAALSRSLSFHESAK